MRVPSIRFYNNNFEECIEFCTLKNRCGEIIRISAKNENDELFVHTKNGWKKVNNGQVILNYFGDIVVKNYQENPILDWRLYE